MVKRLAEVQATKGAPKLPPCACARCFGLCYRCQVQRRDIETLDTNLPLGDLDAIWLSPDERNSGIMLQRDYRRGPNPPVEYRIVKTGRLMAERMTS